MEFYCFWCSRRPDNRAPIWSYLAVDGEHVSGPLTSGHMKDHTHLQDMSEPCCFIVYHCIGGRGWSPDAETQLTMYMYLVGLIYIYVFMYMTVYMYACNLTLAATSHVHVHVHVHVLEHVHDCIHVCM